MSRAKITKILTLKELWAQACEWDGIDPRETSVVFSNNNPFLPDLDKASRLVRKFTRLQMEQARLDREAAFAEFGKPPAPAPKGGTDEKVE